MGDEDDVPPREGDYSPDDRSEGERKRLFERVVPEVLKGLVERAVERSVGRIAEGPENLRHFVNEAKLPKEVLHYLYTQIDETKNGLYRAVAKEIRDVLEHTQFAEEMTKVLTKLSFEIKTEIRFIPNDAAKPAEPETVESKPVEVRATDSRAVDRNADARSADAMTNLVVKSTSGPVTGPANAMRPPAPIPAPAQTAGARRVAAVQRALTQYGYGQLKPTGAVGADTQAAISKFERDRKLPVTGQMSDRLVRELSAMTGHPID